MTLLLELSRRIMALNLIVLMGGCAGYVAGEKAYWDSKVDELCRQDRGVRILQQLRLTKDELALMAPVGGQIDVPIKEAAYPSSPAYAVTSRSTLHGGNPEVTRNVTEYVRRSDNAVIARKVVYARFGGDAPSFGHPSSHSCPNRRRNLIDLQSLFAVDE